ncbi:MAG: EamA family transporter [Firmicutes bacterium]|nr:EamA family transporter [Bacillota bacterium]MBQ6841928.1 EamA family transporter [Bacillota bacterium]MBR6823511.1 EamA family transporter [Bacillota bacterium]
MSKFFHARAAVCTAMVIWGTLGIFTRNIAVTSGELALYRAVLATVMLLGYLLLSGQRIRLKSLGKDLPLLLFSGAAMGVNWILLFEAYRYTTISVATLSYYFAPVIVMAVCPLLFREKPSRTQLICFLMSTCGLVLITVSGGALGGGSRDSLGILFGLGAASLYATVILLNKFITRVAGLQRTVLQFVAAIIVLTPYVLLTSGFHLQQLDGLGWVCLLVLGLVHTGIAYVLYFSSIKDLSGQTVAMLSYIDPLVAVLISVTVLGESMTLMQAMGGLLILGFTFWNERQSA